MDDDDKGSPEQAVASFFHLSRSIARKKGRDKAGVEPTFPRHRVDWWKTPKGS